jgi:pyruvate ferredoxin oxidoreductase gamma subunit
MTRTAVGIPVKNDLGFFEIRLESIGGLGANVAGKILTEAAILGMGLNGAGFASYGSEKKGTPVKANIRLCEADQQVRINSPIEEPHVLAIFHEALAKSVPVTAGAVPGKTTVLLNTRKTPKEARDFLKLEGGKIGVVDAMEIAMATGSRVNMVMMGAITRAASTGSTPRPRSGAKSPSSATRTRRWEGRSTRWGTWCSRTCPRAGRG